MRYRLAAASLVLASLTAAEIVRAQGAPALQAAPPALANYLPSILAHERRQEDRARDAFRHPAETLAFFKVEPGMTVVEVVPGSGWYTRILVPLLAGKGRYIALNPDVTRADRQTQEYLGGLARTFPAKATEWTGQPASSIAAYNTNELPTSLDGTVDRVLIFREMHSLHRRGLMHNELATYRRLLKPDGLLGIVQHRAPRNAPASYTDGHKGYMRENDIIALLDLYGFALAAHSDINANPQDPANHPEGVWELLPNLRTKRELLRAIGESDRMTLLFRKRP